MMDSKIFRTALRFEIEGLTSREAVGKLMAFIKAETGFEIEAADACMLVEALQRYERLRKVAVSTASLGKLSPTAYSRIRRERARELDLDVNELDRLVEEVRDVIVHSNVDDLVEEVEPWADPVDGKVLLEELRRVIREYVRVADGDDLIIALWILHTWVVECSHVSPILAITSPDRRCGKSTLLKLLAVLVRRPFLASNITAAGLFRVIEACQPTLLVDEADSFAKGNEPVRNVLNAGHDRANAFIVRCNVETLHPERFHVYGPKAIASIGALHETLTDRSIEISMQRSTVHVKKLRAADRDELRDLQRKCARWAKDNLESVRSAAPMMPTVINRAEDNWFEILRIAAVTGGTAETLKVAGRLLKDDVEAGPNEMLLSDIRDIYREDGRAFIESNVLCEKLAELEHRPWGEWKNSRPITPIQLAKRLRSYMIRPEQQRHGRHVVRGYEKAVFADAWERYLSESGTGVTSDTEKIGDHDGGPSGNSSG